MLASLDLMIKTDSLTRRVEIDSPSDLNTQNGINVTHNGMLLKWDITNNGMSIKMECHFKWNATFSGISHKIECRKKYLMGNISY